MPPVWSRECAWVKTFENILDSVLFHSLLSSLNPVSENKNCEILFVKTKTRKSLSTASLCESASSLSKGPSCSTTAYFFSYFPSAPYFCLLSSLLPSTSPQPIFLSGALIFSQNAELLPSKPLQHLGPFCMSITQKHPHAVLKDNMPGKVCSVFAPLVFDTRLSEFWCWKRDHWNNTTYCLQCVLRV